MDTEELVAPEQHRNFAKNSSSKIALITGGSEGLGAACARRFLRAGWKVAILALPGPEIDGMASNDVLTVSGDITSPDTRHVVVEKTLERFERIDVLVNNVGVGLYAPPSQADIELTKRLFDVNVFAPLALTQLVAPLMRRQGGGTIVNVGSVGGLVSLPWAVIYCASKFAVHAIDDSLHRELGPQGIRVIKVCPGIIETKFREHVLDGEAPPHVVSIRKTVPPDRVAKAILRAIENGSRTVYVPWIGRSFTAMGILAPRLMDWYLARKWR